MEDKTYEELEDQLLDILLSGNTFWGKFTCANCGSRQTFEVPNLLFTSGQCEECGGVTKLSKWGITVLLRRESPSSFKN